MWIKTTRAIAALPTWVDRIHAIEQLTLDPTDTIASVVADTGTDIDVGDDPHLAFWRVAADVLARVMPSDQWIPLLAQLADADFTHERMGIVEIFVSQRGAALVPPAIAAFDTLPRHALRRINLAWRQGQPPPQTLVAAWPLVLALASHSDPATALEASMLAIRGRQVTPMVITVLARTLAEAIETSDPESYDEQVNIEEMLGAIAECGPALRELAPSLVPFLRGKAMAWRAAATIAAIGIGAFTLRGEIEKVLARVKNKDLGAQIERSLFLYASWLFGGPTDALARATKIAGENIVSMFRLRQAFEVSAVDDRILAGLRGVADDLAWTAQVCDALATLGPRAATAVAGIAAPRPTDEAYTPWVIARYRCGVASPVETRVALEANLSQHGWALYAELAVDDPLAEQRIRAELAHPPGESIPDCVPAIAGVPALGARLMPLLLANGYDAIVHSLWTQGVPL